MSAYFISLKKINCISLGVHVEVPYTKNLASQT